MYDYSNNKRVWVINISSSTDRWGIKTCSDGVTAPSNATSISVDTNWHNFGFVVNNTTKAWDFYLDGVFMETITAAKTYANQSSFIEFGGINGGSCFDGRIDNVKIYNYARTSLQIQMDYNNGLAAHLK